ncbi:DUF2971 domain-containing protein [Pseudomonas putida]|uniref:DUF2971 domain-containing protein n=1 Tax=Pseudomonas putida TaxID=303 RepID=UPI0009C07383|nr:DUF2971 domain-containing protein [Pseudomonas putida]
MIKTLFKYMPYRADFFDLPLIRITPSESLNDPFDFKMTKEAVRKRLGFMVDEGGEGNLYVSDEDIEGRYNSEYQYLVEGLDDCGVISLTEDSRNLLMWAHYACDHTGIVFELNNSEDSFDWTGSASTPYGFEVRSARSVTYSAYRTGADISDEIAYSFYDDDIFQHFALLKGNDWIYEKEHRLVLSLRSADAAIFTVGSNFNAYKEHLDARCLQYKVLGDKVLVMLPGEGRDFMAVSAAVQIFVGLPVMYFKLPKPSAIKAIYFGCNVSDDKRQEAIEKVRASKCFSSNLMFYRAVVSQKRFELSFELLGCA